MRVQSNKNKLLLLMSAALEQVGQHHLVEPHGNVYRLIIYAVADGVLLDVGGLYGHLLAIFVGYLGGVDLQPTASFEIDEFRGAIRIVEQYFMPMVEGVKKNHFVFAMAQMAQGIHERVMVVGFDQSIGEDDHERPFVQLLSGEV